MGERDGAQQEGIAVEVLVDSENGDCFRVSLCCRVKCRPSKLACAPVARMYVSLLLSLLQGGPESPRRLERVGQSVRL